MDDLAMTTTVTSVEECASLEDILVVFVSCINPKCKP